MLQTGLENESEQGKFSTAGIPLQIIPQKWSSEHTLLLSPWTCDLMACTVVTPALNPGLHCCSPALLPLETALQALSPLLAATVHPPWSIFSWVTSTRFKVELRETDNKYFCPHLFPPHMQDSQINELSKLRKGSKVGQPGKQTKYPL